VLSSLSAPRFVGRAVELRRLTDALTRPPAAVLVEGEAGIGKSRLVQEALDEPGIELESVEWRQYTGLDDKTLDLLEKVDVASLGEANLDFASVQFMFLPGELERAEAAFDAARSTATADERWVAGLEQYEPVLDALETSRAAYEIGNSATALGVILAVFERHVGELAEGWFDAASRGDSGRYGTSGNSVRRAGNPGGDRSRRTGSDRPLGAGGLSAGKRALACSWHSG
jgi:hypothetical protein